MTRVPAAAGENIKSAAGKILKKFQEGYSRFFYPFVAEGVSYLFGEAKAHSLSAGFKFHSFEIFGSRFWFFTKKRK